MISVEDLDPKRMPQHVAIIMDGNGRWAQQQGYQRLFGHQHALTAVKEAIRAAIMCHIPYLTLYAFSTENWNRPADEVDGLMELLSYAISEEFQEFRENGIRLQLIGDIDRLPEKTRAKLLESVSELSHESDRNLIVAISYSSRWEITNAVRQIARKVADGSLSPEQIDDACISSHLTTAGLPDPDLLIRTGGEQRISNFLLWQMAYAEFYFSNLLWPDFRREHFFEAIADYQNRQRRFGKSGDQIIAEQNEKAN